MRAQRPASILGVSAASRIRRDEEANVASRVERWWRASAVEWLKAAGIVLGGLAAAVLLVNLIIFVMGLL